jgi:uncharacterized protein (DUF488 family)
MDLYTIGFTHKSAAEFFGLIHDQRVRRVIDIRLNPSGQLSGFARREDLPYFLHELAGKCEYVYQPILSPTKEILHDVRQDKDWERYAARFEALMDKRDIPNALDQSLFDSACLLCSEATPDHCHRRLVAERLARHWSDVKVIHI